MLCEMCRKDPDLYIILPAKQTNGCLNTIVCFECAIKSGHYCEKHQMAHLGFIDGDTTACRMCIDEQVITNAGGAKDIYRRICGAIYESEREEMNEAAQLAADIMSQSIELCVLRFVATKALRLGTTIDDIVERIVVAKRVDIILPHFI